MARAAEGDVASLCDAILMTQSLGGTVSKGKGRTYAAALSWAGLQNHPSASSWVYSCRTELCCIGLLEKYLSVKQEQGCGIGGR